MNLLLNTTLVQFRLLHCTSHWKRTVDAHTCSLYDKDVKHAQGLSRNFFYNYTKNQQNCKKSSNMQIDLCLRNILDIRWPKKI